MQTQDTVMLPEKPYAYEGLTVLGVSPYRLTPRPNENITVPDEVGRTIVRRNLARRLTESRIAIAMVGLGLRPAALTVRAHVQAMISFAGLARVAANMPPTEKLLLTPKPAHRFEESDGVRSAGYDATQTYIIDDEVNVSHDRAVTAILRADRDALEVELL